MEHIGFIGLGVMGRPMAGHLLRAGYPLIVLNRSPAAQVALVASGALPGETPRQVAASSNIVITMLPDTPDVEAVVFGPDGVLAGLRPGSLLIDMSSVLPALARRIAAAAAERGCEALDAPVSGGQTGAEHATLSIMVGGTEAAFAHAQPILVHLGKNIVHIGPAGAGQITKAANQAVVAVTIAAVAEALVLAEQAGADPARVRTALLGGFAQSRVLDLHGARMIERRFEPGFRARLHQKDLGIVLQTAHEHGVAAPTTTAAAELMQQLAAHNGELDHAALITVIERHIHTS